MTVYLILTSVAVSIDSLLAGVSIGLDGKDKQKKALGVIFAVLLLCMSACVVGRRVFYSFSALAVRLGGVLLLGVGIFSLIRTLFGEENHTNLADNLRFKPLIKNSGRANPLSAALFSGIITGLGVGTDGAVACLSLCLEGYGYTAAWVVSAFHYAFVQAGITVGGAAAKLKGSLGLLSPLLLIALGLFRLL